MEDQARFVQLYLRQRDLAERLTSLKGHDREDDPASKARMRDLEAEQKQIRSELGRLLDDIEEHARLLPDDPQLAKLRETAQEFAAAVRASGAAEAMTDAEEALAAFAGTRSFDSAKPRPPTSWRSSSPSVIERRFNQAGQGCLASSRCCPVTWAIRSSRCSPTPGFRHSARSASPASAPAQARATVIARGRTI